MNASVLHSQATNISTSHATHALFVFRSVENSTLQFSALWLNLVLLESSFSHPDLICPSADHDSESDEVWQTSALDTTSCCPHDKLDSAEVNPVSDGGR